ncbi:MAG: helix-turn-helix domain-containing protein [Acidimicrobiales bacterium]
MGEPSGNQPEEPDEPDEPVQGADPGDPASGLQASLALHRLAERMEAVHVTTARAQGWSWQQIGDALGVTRQSVHLKHGKDVA